ncbi:MAG TPA: hypothetical protein VKU89_02550 [Solirubrobacteraceae bacterium]|nr:hypothetical protein [Solirubrobacteraceae bacterium]
MATFAPEEEIGPQAAPVAEGLAEEPGVPPCTPLAMVALALIVSGGAYLASNIPHRVPLGPAWALLGCALGTMVLNALLLARAGGFAFRRFFTVFRWGLLAYVVSAGMIEYVFVYDGVRGSTLIVLSGMLVVFALTVPFSIAFTVARYAHAGD